MSKLIRPFASVVRKLVLAVFIAQCAVYSGGIGVANASTANGPELVSQSSAGEAANDNSVESSISDDGRYVTFISRASNLVNGVSGSRVYLRDRNTNQTTLVSTTSSGEPLNGRIYHASITGDGRHLLLSTRSTNLPPFNTSGPYYYIKNLDTGEVTQPFPDLGGSQLGSLEITKASASDNAEYVVLTRFQPNTNISSVHVKNVVSGVEETVAARGYARSISGDGSKVIFNDLPDQTPTPFVRVFDRATNITKPLVKASSVISSTISVSDDGTYALFGTDEELVPGANSNCSVPNGSCIRVYRMNLSSGVVERVDVNQDGLGPTPAPQYGETQVDYSPEISGNGNVAVWGSHLIMRSNKTQHPYFQIYSKNLSSGVVKLVSVNSSLQPHNGTNISIGQVTYDGSEVVGHSIAGNLGAPPACPEQGPTFAPQSIQQLATNLVACVNVYVFNTNPNEITDTTAPVFQSVDTPETNITPGLYSRFSAVYQDAGAGVAGGEAWVGADPGKGNATTASVIWPDVNTLRFHMNGDQFPAPGTYTVSYRAYDHVGNWTGVRSFTVSVVSPDSTPPVLGNVSWTNNPKRIAQTATLTVPVTDDVSGVAGGEYYLGSTDPGQGSGTALTLNGANLTASFGPSTPTGVYQVNVRARDNAGNWSTPSKMELVVYNPNGPRISGNGSVTPSLANGDVLPGLSLNNQTDRATFNMNVRYTNGAINNTSSFSLTYTTVPLCIITLNFANCHTTTVNSTSMSWLVIDGQNQSEGIFQGTASVTKDGVTTSNPFRITALDGSRINSTTSDRLAVSIFAPGANPATATPLYRIGSATVTGNITIQ